MVIFIKNNIILWRFIDCAYSCSICNSMSLYSSAGIVIPKTSPHIRCFSTTGTYFTVLVKLFTCKKHMHYEITSYRKRTGIGIYRITRHHFNYFAKNIFLLLLVSTIWEEATTRFGMADHNLCDLCILCAAGGAAIDQDQRLWRNAKG